MTRVLIADDHEVVRDGVRGFLERHTNYVVVAEAADGEEAIAKAIETEPDRDINEMLEVPARE